MKLKSSKGTVAGLLILCALMLFGLRCSQDGGSVLPLHAGDHIVLMGNNFGSRMMNYGHFETELHLRYPDSALVVRNMSDAGNTPGFRPHSGRVSPWAFPGADSFYTDLARPSNSQGHFETPDEWLTRLQTDVIIAFFGYNESFAGSEGVVRFEQELEAFVEHSVAQHYNGASAPAMALVSPPAFEDLSDRHDLPDGELLNAWIGLYAEAMERVAHRKGVVFVDLYSETRAWYRSSNEPYTIDGLQLTDAAYALIAPLLVDALFGRSEEIAESQRGSVLTAVLDKNWYWHNDFKIPNGVHVFGRRYNPFGPDNYPAELQKIRQMTAIRDTAVWMAARGLPFDVAAADQRTTILPVVETNYRPEGGPQQYLYGEDAIAALSMAPGYRIELFASEREYPELANPVQLSFDNAGRLWVAVMPSYPHYRPGDSRPDDKLLILEDTDRDGRADTLLVWADGLHIPAGFEFAPEGVYVSQGTNLVLLSDSDGDDRADRKEIILSGFDDHDTHHVISAFTADPSGAIYMAEGVFLHTNVETPYGPVRGTNGGFYRYSPQRRHLERTAQLSIPNPWGIAFDEWGQVFFAETSGPAVNWLMPGTIKPRYGVATHKSYNLIEPAHQVRPTSGLEFVSSRHFPDEVQGDLLLNNTIGFLGMKQHMMEADATGYKTQHRQDLVKGSDPNFRPVDMEFAPDGSLYLVDWHNILIGHMQHNARDPLRDHEHGRIYRITYPSRPLVEPAPVAGASIDQLLDNLLLPEYRTRYRTRRELRARNKEDVLAALNPWIERLDTENERYEHHLLEALWVTWGLNAVDASLLHTVLRSRDYRARAAAVRVLRYSGHQIEDQDQLLMEAARDDHGQVRLEALVAASWLSPERGLPVVEQAMQLPMDKWITNAAITAFAYLSGDEMPTRGGEEMPVPDGVDAELYALGQDVYARDGYCATCHGADGKGLQAAGFPPLAGADWVTGSKKRLAQIALDGLIGPITVLGEQYSGTVPMTPFKNLLTDEELAAVLTYVRNSFGNEASQVTPEEVGAVREATRNKVGFYTAAELANQ